MSSIFDLDVDGSSDENDGDYVPPTGVVASDSSGEDDASFDEDSETEQKPKSRKGKGNTKKGKKPETAVASSVPPVDQKKRAENIWLDFLSDVSKTTPTAKKTAPSECKVSKTGDIAPECNEVSKTGDFNEEKPQPTELVKETKDEIFEFAGETFKVSDESVPSKECSDTGVAEANSVETPLVAKQVKRSGVESILGSISNKKKKLTTLEKTLYDWKSFKKTEGLDEDLEKYNKGKGGFIERQRFLERSDYRSFEIEKNMRQSKRKM